MDYEEDKKRGRYNPLVLSLDAPLSACDARSLLMVYISQCVDIFRRLPILRDCVIIENILYSGVWQAFRKKYGSDGNGSSE